MFLYGILRYGVVSIDSLLFRVEVQGAENLPKDGGFIIASNHPRRWEQFPLLVHLPIRHMCWVTTDRFFRVPIMGRVLRRLGYIPASRSNGAKNAQAIRMARRRLGQGVVVGIFPEGVNSGSGDALGAFREGVGMISRVSGCPIVPVAVKDFPRHFPQLHVLPLRRPVVVSIGEPIYPTSLEGERLTAHQLTALTQERVQELIRDMTNE
jgi:1-acyl-sn-glycerol-3-phosphate acyltransferase